MFNLELDVKDRLSTFRRIALGTWRTARDPTVYGSMNVVMDRALDYISDFREKTGKRVTITHLVTRAVAEALREVPDANAVLRRGRIYLRRNIAVCMQVLMTDGGKGKIDLSVVTVQDAADKTLADIADEVEASVRKVRQRQDPRLEKARSMFKNMPTRVVAMMLEMISFLNYELNLDLSRFGVPKDAFGSVMVTNIGSLGLDVAYVPLVPYSKVPLMLAVGAAEPQPVVEGDEVVVRKVMRLSASFDHRFIDGYHAARMAEIVKAWLEAPYEHFDRLD